MKKLFLLMFAAFFLFSCGDGSKDDNKFDGYHYHKSV